MRIQKILNVSLFAASFTLVGCVAESNSGAPVETDDIAITQETQDSANVEEEPSEPAPPPRPSDNMDHGNLFQGGEDNFNVHTGLEKDETAGKWYITNDNEIGGQSNVYFPIAVTEESGFNENIAFCKGFCDTVKIAGNISTPYAGVGVNLVNKEQEGADITDWGGIVIEYVSTHHPLIIALIPEGVTDNREFYHYDLPACPGHRAIRWSDFAQVDERLHKRNLEEDLKHIAALQFIVGGIDGDETFVKITSLGTFYLREGEKPHDNPVAASSSSNANPFSTNSAESSSSDNINSSASELEDQSSSSSETASTSASAEPSSSEEGEPQEDTSSSSDTAYSLDDPAFPPSSSSEEPQSSALQISPFRSLSSSSESQPWQHFGSNGSR